MFQCALTLLYLVKPPIYLFIGSKIQLNILTLLIEASLNNMDVIKNSSFACLCVGLWVTDIGTALPPPPQPSLQAAPL